MREAEVRIRDAVKDLFNTGRVDLVIGYEKGSFPMMSRPCFIHDAHSVGRLVWNSTCRNNLAVYLRHLFPVQKRADREKKPLPRVGIVTKGCDARSIAGLIKENQVSEENLILIGVPCPGMVDPAGAVPPLDLSTVTECVETHEGIFEITYISGEKVALRREEILAEACIECRYTRPEKADVTIQGEPRACSSERYDKIAAFEDKTPEERWRYFREEISKCIRCYACRQACPNCFCKVCFIDQTKPRWAGVGEDLSDIMLFHLGRIFHQAGRCVECDACVDACPMHIDLRMFTRKLGKEVLSMFDYIPGLSDEDPPLCTYRQDDNESFITEPEEE